MDNNVWVWVLIILVFIGPMMVTGALEVLDEVMEIIKKKRN